MSFKQCSGCKSMVAESKAFCPDCDTPMDIEQKRQDSAEFDSQMKTINISSTSQHILMEQLNLSTFFNLARPDEKESKPEENEIKVVQSNETVIQPTFIQQNPIINLTESKAITPQIEFKIDSLPPSTVEIDQQNNSNFPGASPNENTPNSRKIFYLIGGISLVLTFLVIVLIVAIISFFYFNLWK